MLCRGSEIQQDFWWRTLIFLARFQGSFDAECMSVGEHLPLGFAALGPLVMRHLTFSEFQGSAFTTDY
jgi:hypothetical protein